MDRMQEQSILQEKSSAIGHFRIIRTEIIIANKTYKIT